MAGQCGEQERCRLLDSCAELEKPSSRDSSPGEQEKVQPVTSRPCRFAECTVTAFLDPRRLAYPYMCVALLCLAKMCVLYCQDMPAALERIIINVMRVDTTQYELLYSLYSWPGVIMTVIGGILIDKVFGLRLALILFATVTCLGQLVFAVGGYFNMFWLMVVGRTVYGGAYELTATAADIFAVSLFRDRKLSFVFGLVFGAGRLGSTLNLVFSSRLYDAFYFISDRNARLSCVLLFGFVVCLICLVSILLVVGLDYSREKILKKKREKRGQFKLKDIKNFSLSFWIITLLGLLYFAAVFPFISIAQVFFEQKYAYRAGMANLVNGFLFLPTIVSYPLFGLIFDWTGYKLYWGMFSNLGTQACHFALAFAGPEYFIPVLATLCLGLCYTMFTCSVWPQLFLLVEEHQFATAYGIAYASYELGQALSPIIVGALVDKSGYLLVELFFASVLSLTLMLLIALYILDTMYGGQKLNMSGRRRRMMTRLKEQEEKIAVAQPVEEPVTAA